MALTAQEFARRSGASIEVAPAPVRLDWSLMGMTTADSHNLSGEFSCSARLADNPTDRRMFAEMFLGQSEIVMLGDLARHFRSALGNTAAELARVHSAQDWIEGACRQSMIDALRKSAESIAFSCGLELLPPFQLHLHSASFNATQLEQVARARAEERTTSHVAHLKRAAEVLAQFQQMRRQAPELAPGALLEQLAESDRGQVLQALLAGAAKESERQTLFAVAGPNLLRIDGRSADARIETVQLPTTLGPLRSVQEGQIQGRRVLLIGARSGVIVVEIERSEVSALYTDSSIQSDLGFNRVVCWQDRIWGCHGEVGLVAWKLEELNQPAHVMRPPKDAPPVGSSSSGGAAARTLAPRHLQIIDDRHAIVSVGSVIKILDPETRLDLASPSDAPVADILQEPQRLLIVRSDGSVDLLDRQTREWTGHVRLAGRASAVAALPWMGTIRLLMADDDGPIDCLGLDDSVVMRYTSTHRGFRSVAATEDLIAAISSDRQRLILWRPWEASPSGEIHIAATTRHRIADAQFI